MAASVSFQYDDGVDGKGQRCRVRKLIVNWTSATNGTASGTSRKIVGRLVKAVTVPTDGPTDNYDVTIADDNSVDVLASCQATLADRDTSNTEETYFQVNDAGGPRVCSPLTFSIAAAGNTKSGRVIVYFSPL